MEMQDELVRVEFISLTTTPASDGAYILVLGEVGGIRKLAIVVGEGEATAILIGVENKHPPRPMSHDLLCDVMERAEMEVSDVLIDGLEQGTFYAKIRFFHNGKYGILDSRPSDAVAIAVRLNTQILVSESVLEAAGVPASEGKLPAHEEETRETGTSVEKLKQRLASAIEEEDYEEAARLRDALAKLKS